MSRIAVIRRPPAARGLCALAQKPLVASVGEIHWLGALAQAGDGEQRVIVLGAPALFGDIGRQRLADHA